MVMSPVDQEPRITILARTNSHSVPTRTVCQARNSKKQDFACYLLHVGFCLAYFSTLNMERRILPKRLLTFNGLLGIYTPEDKPLFVFFF
jgi:hypothetical protein